MSLGYSITTIIDVVYIPKNIESVLVKGLELGFSYYEYSLGMIEINGPSLSIKEALHSILDDKTKSKLYCIVAKVNDTYTTIDFIAQNGNLLLMFSDFTYPWLKKFDGTDEIDIGRYAKIMLDLVQDYKILHMSIEKN
jgi:hypothetical protein